MMFYPDFVEHPAEGGFPSYGRQIFMRLLSLEASHWRARAIGRKLRLVSSGPEVATLGRLEKNWSPFVANGSIYVHQWLDNGNGSAVALRVNRTSGLLTHRYETSNSGLHQAVGAPAGAHLRGGTLAIQLNATHFLAVGHSRSNRSYGMFCYLFSSNPPFQLLGATPEFAIKPLEADLEGEGINWHPPHAAHGRVQFPSVRCIKFGFRSRARPRAARCRNFKFQTPEGVSLIRALYTPLGTHMDTLCHTFTISYTGV